MLRLWPLILCVVPVLATATVSSPVLLMHEAVLEQHERRAWKVLTHNSQFSDVPHLIRPRCEDVQPPQALTTPSPLLTSWRERRVKVSFIIGTDGRVHSPLILESAGPTGDRHVLQAVRAWRYRPATCNGVPTETEGKVEFSSR
jgi:TonB family protein